MSSAFFIRDVMFEVATKLDNTELAKLVTPELWDGLRDVLSCNEFWKRRVEHLTGRELSERPDVDWRRVYRSVWLTVETEDLSWRHLDYLPSVLVLEELWDEPDSRQPIWSEIMDPSVLGYLIERGHFTAQDAEVTRCLEMHCSSGREDMITSLLELLRDRTSCSHHLEGLIYIAAEKGQLPVVSLLSQHLDKEGQCLNRYFILGWTAIMGRQLEVLKFVVGGNRGQRLISELVFEATKRGSVQCLDFLYKRGLELGIPLDISVNWTVVAGEALERGHRDVAAYAITRAEAVRT